MKNTIPVLCNTRSLLLAAAVGCASNVLAHGGEEAPTGEWVDKHLTIPHDSNWATEHCMQLDGEGYWVAFEFTSETAVDFDFHVHPDTGDGGYHTDHLDERQAVTSHKSEIGAKHPGAYCFNYIPDPRPPEDKQIHLRYRIEPAG